MKAKPKKPGRPPKPAQSAQSRSLTLRLTPSEDAEIRAAAAEAQLTLRDYLVSRALNYARLVEALHATK